MRKRYTSEEKNELVALYESGQAIRNICAEHHVTKSALYNWIRQNKKTKLSPAITMSATDIVLLQRRVARLAFENEIYKTSGCSVSSPEKEKLEAIKRLRNTYSVHSLCDVLGVRRSTAYYHMNRKPITTLLEKEDVNLREKVKRIFEEHRQCYGARKICETLKQEGIKTTPKRVTRLMKEMELKCNHACPPIRHARPEWRRQYNRNKLNREFNQSAPNKAWVSDITLIKSNGRKYYLCVVIDLFSRKVLSFDLSTGSSTTLVSSAFMQAFVRRNHPSE